MKNILAFLILFIIFGSCKSDKKIAIHDLGATDGTFVNAVIEIPAGTNHKIEYNHVNGVFEVDQKDGQDRIISFLPYPGNYGFIPGTLLDSARGGDGDALDILVLGSSIPTASIQKVNLIGALLLKDGGEIDTKIIGIPAQNPLMEADGFIDFSIRYDAARRIIEDWFLNYKGQGQMELIRWEDENYAMREIKRWQITNEE